MWNTSYDSYREEFEVVGVIFHQFPDRDMQRRHIVELIRTDPYTGFIAAMMWGGIGANRPSTKGGTDTPFRRLLEHPKPEVEKAIKHAKTLIREGKLVQLFRDFSPGGRHKLPGLDAAYFTKLFFFLGEAETEPIPLQPLIWDKWTSNAHCALLIQLLDTGERLLYPGINRYLKNGVSLPHGHARAELYQRYVEDFNAWAKHLGVTPGKLEEFVFGMSLKQDNTLDNPRIALWQIIEEHFTGEDDVSNDVKLPSGKTRRLETKSHGTGIVAGVAEGSKYYPLQQYFSQQVQINSKKLTLSIDEIENLIGSRLPNWAFARPSSFWSNSGFSDHVQKRSWLSQNYRVRIATLDNHSRTGQVEFILEEPT